jgi:FAD/FMN-containing dehydrogenase
MATDVTPRTRIDPAALNALKATFRGELIGPDDPGYEDARHVQNGMIDRHPALIARATDTNDVVAALGLGREQGLDIAIRSGGHNGPGFGTVEGGLVIDLSRMKGVDVDPEKRTVRAQGGALLGDIDKATAPFGLAVPMGVVSPTGIGGLAVGGGLGHLTRKFGLTIDNLLEAEVVLASGEVVKASPDTNSDLFWAIRGGGGNFGIITSFLLRAHPVGDKGTVMAGPVLYDIDQAENVFRWWQEFIGQAPDDLNGFFAFLIVPPAPPFPEELQLRTMCATVWTYAGPMDKAEEVFAPIKAFGSPALYGVQPLPLPAWQSAFDGLFPKGTQMYWRSDFFTTFPDEAIALHAKHGAKIPTVASAAHVYPVDGAAGRVGRGDTAWNRREARFVQVLVGADGDPAKAAALRDWATTYSDALHPYSAGGAYINFIMDEGQERVRATYGDNYDRLVQVKRRYDPQNLFHINQNIRPS